MRSNIDAKTHDDAVPWPPYDPNGEWRQRFVISRDQGFVRKDDRYSDPRNRNRRLSHTWVLIHLSSPYPPTAPPDVIQAHLDTWMKEPTARYLAEDKQSIMLNYMQAGGSQHYIKVVFVYRRCDVFLQLSSRPGENSDGTEEMILQFARSICRHLDQHFAGGKPAAPSF